MRKTLFILIMLFAALSLFAAFNPEYSDKTESNHRCILNKGVVMSFAASQNMATSAPSAAVMRYLCKKTTSICSPPSKSRI